MKNEPAGPVERLLRPRSVAIVGFSSRPGSAGQGALECLRINRFSGSIHLVSRNAESIDGLTSVVSVDDLPESIDLAVLTLPAAAVSDAIAACVRRRVGAAMVFAAGFAETGERGAQEGITRIAREGGLALVGPNCQGFINNVDGLAMQAFIAPKAKRFTRASQAGMALVGQSGGMLSHARRAAQARGTPISYLVSTGNEAGLDLVDFTQYLVDDAATQVIVVYAEQIRRPGDFLAACKRARAAGKSVVLLHGGRGARAQRAVQSHTGAMVSDFGAMRTLVTDAGVLMVESLDELIDVADLLVRCPVPPTAGPAIMTSSGAFVALTHDFCEGLGLEIPQVSENTKAALRQALPDFQVAANPLDILANNTEGITTAARALIEDPKMGSLFVFMPMDGKLGVPAMQSVLKGIEGTRQTRHRRGMGRHLPASVGDRDGGKKKRSRVRAITRSLPARHCPGYGLWSGAAEAPQRLAPQTVAWAACLGQGQRAGMAWKAIPRGGRHAGSGGGARALRRRGVGYSRPRRISSGAESAGRRAFPQD